MFVNLEKTYNKRFLVKNIGECCGCTALTVM